MQGAWAVVTIDDSMRILIQKNVHVDANGDNDEEYEEELDYVNQFACI